MTKASSVLPAWDSGHQGTRQQPHVTSGEQLTAVEVKVPESDVHLEVEVAEADVHLLIEVVTALQSDAIRSKTRLFLQCQFVDADDSDGALVKAFAREARDSALSEYNSLTAMESFVISSVETKETERMKWIARLSRLTSFLRSSETSADTSDEKGEDPEPTLKEMFFTAPLEGIDLERNRSVGRDVKL